MVFFLYLNIWASNSFCEEREVLELQSKVNDVLWYIKQVLMWKTHTRKIIKNKQTTNICGQEGKHNKEELSLGFP